MNQKMNLTESAKNSNAGLENVEFTEDYNGFDSREKYEYAHETAEDIIGECEVYCTDDWWGSKRLKVVFDDEYEKRTYEVFLVREEHGDRLENSVEVRVQVTSEAGYNDEVFCCHELNLTWDKMEKIVRLTEYLKSGDFDEVFGIEEEMPF